MLVRLMENMYFPNGIDQFAPPPPDTGAGIEVAFGLGADSTTAHGISGKRPCSQTKVIAAAAVADRKIDAMRRPSG